MNKSHFANTYTSFSNFQLYEILQNKDDYQEEALQAAQEEFDKRQLSESEMALVIEEWKLLQDKKLRSENKKREIEHKIKDVRDKAIADLDPFTPSDTNRRIRMICVSIAVIYLISFYSSYQSLLFTIKYWTKELSPLLPTYLPLILVPLGIWKFWNKKKLGWIILVGWLTLVIAGAFILLIPSFLMILTGSFAGFPNDHLGFGELFYWSGGALIISIIKILVYGALIRYLFRPAITTLFNITSNTKFYTLLSTFTLGICYLVIIIAMYHRVW